MWIFVYMCKFDELLQFDASIQIDDPIGPPTPQRQIPRGVAQQKTIVSRCGFDDSIASLN